MNGNGEMVRRYRTPEGFDDLAARSDGEALTGLHFLGDGAAGEGMAEIGAGDLPVFVATRRWLDAYFGGREPGERPPFRLAGATEFREQVLRETMRIPFGATATYGEVAAAVARRRGMARMSAQAVGQALGWNPACLIVPCHRVVAAAGMGGYGGGVRNKAALLAHERKWRESRGDAP